MTSYLGYRTGTLQSVPLRQEGLIIPFESGNREFPIHRWMIGCDRSAPIDQRAKCDPDLPFDLPEGSRSAPAPAKREPPKSQALGQFVIRMLGPRRVLTTAHQTICESQSANDDLSFQK